LQARFRIRIRICTMHFQVYY